jgi:hypothetical protein
MLYSTRGGGEIESNDTGVLKLPWYLEKASASTSVANIESNDTRIDDSRGISNWQKAHQNFLLCQ